MAKALTVDEALERAERLQQNRLEAVRALAEARQTLADVRANAERRRAELEAELAGQVSAAEGEDVLCFNAAVTAGWTTAELRKIGLDEPEKKARVRKRQAARQGADQAQNARAGAPEHGTDGAAA